MGSKSGYEYRHRVSLGDEFVEKEGVPTPKWRTFFLEVRTNFLLKPISPPGEILIDTERFGDRMAVNDDDVPRNLGPKVFWMVSGTNAIDAQIRDRLSKYCMPNAQIRALAQAIFDFVHDPQHNSLYTIPVLAAIDVCTVQLEGEPLAAAVERSVKPEFMAPLQLRWISDWKSPKIGDFVDLQLYLIKLPVVRVREDSVSVREDVDIEIESCPICVSQEHCFMAGWKDDKHEFHKEHSVGLKEGLGLMEVCPVCLRAPVVGTMIAPLPCKHYFHDHCINRCMLKCQSCPVCHVEVVYKPDYSKLLE